MHSAASSHRKVGTSRLRRKGNWIANPPLFCAELAELRALPPQLGNLFAFVHFEVQLAVAIDRLRIFATLGGLRERHPVPCVCIPSPFLASCLLLRIFITAVVSASFRLLLCSPRLPWDQHPEPLPYGRSPRRQCSSYLHDTSYRAYRLRSYFKWKKEPIASKARFGPRGFGGAPSGHSSPKGRP